MLPHSPGVGEEGIGHRKYLRIKCLHYTPIGIRRYTRDKQLVYVVTVNNRHA